MKSLSRINSQEPFSTTPWLVCFGTVLAFCPVLVYFYSIYIYATNIPFSDDYPKHLNEIIPIIQSDKLWEKLTLIFSHSFETLLLFNKVIILLIYSVWGEIDLKLALIFGNSTLLGLLFFAYKTLPEKREKIFLVLPAALLLFQLKENWIYMTWSSSHGCLYALFFSGLVFYFLEKSPIKYFFGAGFFAICSAFSFGSGVATLATGWLILIIQKRFKLSWVWLGATLIFFSSYSFMTKLTSSVTSSLLTISSLSDLIQMGKFFTSFLGAMFSFENQTTIFTFGTLIVCYFIFLLYKKYYAINLAVFSFMVYVILVAAIVALFRTKLGENAVFADRYKIHSLTMVLLIYISLVDLFYSNINRKWVFMASMIMITGSMYLVSYIEGKQKLEFAKYILVWRMNQWLDQNFNLMAHPFQNQANAIMTRALTSGFYNVPYQLVNIPDEKFSPLISSAGLCSQKSEASFESDFNIITVGPKLSPFLVRIEGMIYGQRSAIAAKPEPVHIILSSHKQKYMFTAHSQEHVEKSIHFRHGKSNKGMLALIPFRKLKDNIYRLGLCYRRKVVFNNHFIIKQDHQFKHVIK